MTTGKIAGTVHKSPLTPETVQVLFTKGELSVRRQKQATLKLLCKQSWFYISLHFG